MANVDTPDDQIIAVNYGDVETDDWAAKHQISLSEQASRLDAKQHFDNRGRQIWTDGFENLVVQWNVILIGGATAVRSTISAWRGNACALFTVPAVALAHATIQKYFYSPETGRYGIEFAWSSDNNDFRYLYMETYINDGTRLYNATVRVDGNTGRLQYQNNTGAYTTFGNPITQIDDIHFWHKMKLVYDTDLMEYVRFLFDGNEYDLSGIPLYSIASALTPRIDVCISLVSDGAAIYTAKIDDFILTHLEP